jgi:ribonuclease E
MTKRMLIDATHAEETRVVVLDGSRLEDFDVETSTKRQLKGNIYLAKVVRVEPSLQAAFVEYGGNRHGFLAFGEIHPDYYQIPVADRQRLIEMEAEEARLEEEEADLELALHQSSSGAPAHDPARDELPFAAPQPNEPDVAGPEPWALAAVPLLIAPDRVSAPVETPAAEAWALAHVPPLFAPAPEVPVSAESAAAEAVLAEPVEAETVAESYPADEPANDDDEDDDSGFAEPEAPPPETVGGEAENGYEQRERRLPPRFLRNYKIQEVIRRRQILLVQVVKEERGTKGAALTTYLSLAGRFSVLMPNSPRGGGISRKITSAADRRRLKEVMVELDIPKGMGLIVRTAGAQRPKPEIKRDCEYLLRLWDDIREHTMKSVAPALIYEEASLIKRAIRDVYSRDIDEILVDGEEGWRAAHDFMRMLMPSHAKKVQLWREPQPLFARSQVEAQLDGMLQPIVQLRSGGYLVINQAEALVAIDVNSGRSTRERNVEETALRTNLEAADEVARQLRLRDLAGLIVIDFIDMESKRHNAMVERRMKEALKNDRARIQVGHISHFGLLEMSRQRLRPSLAETSFIACPHCGGTGHVRSTESAAIHVLRGIEDEGGKRRSAEVVVHMATATALYILNHKRERLREIEMRYGMRVIVAADDAAMVSQFRIDRVRAQIPGEAPAFITPDLPPPPPMLAAPEPEPEEEEDVVTAEDEDEDEPETNERTEAQHAASGETAAEGERRRRRRRRRRGRRDEAPTGEPTLEAPVAEAAPAAEAEAAEIPAEETHIEGVPEHAEPPGETEEEARNRRRGRRGGRRRRRDSDGELPPIGLPGVEQPELPVYTGPTPANPFGGQAFDIFDVMEQVELNAAAAARQAPAPVRAAEPEVEIVNSGAVEPQPESVSGDAPIAERPEAPALAAGEVTLTPGAEEPPTAADEIVNAPPPEPVGESVAQDPVVEAVPHEAVASAEPTPEPAATPTADPEAVAETAPGPEPAIVEPVAAQSDEPAPPVPANDVIAEPLVKPIVIGAGAEPPVQKKRGWWRR